MTEQYPPGYRDPTWQGDTHPEIHDHEYDATMKTDPEVIREGLERFGEDESTRIMDLASDMMDQFLCILEEDAAVKELGDEEYRFLLAVIRDGWNDNEGE